MTRFLRSSAILCGLCTANGQNSFSMREFSQRFAEPLNRSSHVLVHNRSHGAEAGRLRRRLPGFFSLLLAFATLGSAAENEERFGQYLTRLGLTELHALSLKQQLDSAPAGKGRQSLARQLADVYAGQLVRSAEDSDQFAETMLRIEQLLQRIPEARTPSLEVMLLQAKYYRAEKQITRWLADRMDQEARQQAVQILNRIAPQLDSHQEELVQGIEESVERIDKLEDGEELENAELALAQLQPVAARAVYFAATSSYYLALLSEPQDPVGFAGARDLFKKLLAIEGSYNDYEVSELGLESLWRSRTLIGLALSEEAAGNQAASSRCFTWLEHKSVPASIRDTVPYWRLQALTASGRFDELLEYARRQVTSFTGAATPGRISFSVALVRIGFGAAGMHEIGKLGLAGLMKLRKAAAAGRLLDEYQVEVGPEAGFYLKWIKGRQLFDRANTTNAAADFTQAAELLTAALDVAKAAHDINATAQCRSQLASCFYKLGQRERAARLFEQAADGLRASGDLEASRVAWNAFLGYQSLVRQEPRFVSSAIDVLNRIKRSYPESSHAKLADYHIGKLRQKNLSPEQLLEQWGRVQPGSRTYLAARYDICTVWHQLWMARSGALKQDAANRLVENADLYLAAARTTEQPDRQLRVCLLVMSAALGSLPPDVAVAQRFHGRARILAENASAEVATEYCYRALQLAGSESSSAEVERHAEWILGNPTGTRFEREALKLAIRFKEAALKKSSAAEKQSQAETLYRLLGRLTVLLADTPDDATIANSKLARYASTLGRHQEAAEILEPLLAMPQHAKNKRYLQRAGRAQFLAENHQAALAHWRVLLLGLPRGSDAWYEAKYHQMACLLQLDKERFKRVSNQFRLLHPQLGPPAWRQRFSQLLSD
jgi:hypothetical protein